MTQGGGGRQQHGGAGGGERVGGVGVMTNTSHAMSGRDKSCHSYLRSGNCHVRSFYLDVRL